MSIIKGITDFFKSPINFVKQKYKKYEENQKKEAELTDTVEALRSWATDLETEIKNEKEKWGVFQFLLPNTKQNKVDTLRTIASAMENSALDNAGVQPELESYVNSEATEKHKKILYKHYGFGKSRTQFFIEGLLTKQSDNAIKASKNKIAYNKTANEVVEKYNLQRRPARSKK